MWEIGWGWRTVTSGVAYNCSGTQFLATVGLPRALRLNASAPETRLQRPLSSPPFSATPPNLSPPSHPSFSSSAPSLSSPLLSSTLFLLCRHAWLFPKVLYSREVLSRLVIFAREEKEKFSFERIFEIIRRRRQ